MSSRYLRLKMTFKLVIVKGQDIASNIPKGLGAFKMRSGCVQGAYRLQNLATCTYVVGMQTATNLQQSRGKSMGKTQTAGEEVKFTSP